MIRLLLENGADRTVAVQGYQPGDLLVPERERAARILSKVRFPVGQTQVRAILMISSFAYTHRAAAAAATRPLRTTSARPLPLSTSPASAPLPTSPRPAASTPLPRAPWSGPSGAGSITAAAAMPGPPLATTAATRTTPPRTTSTPSPRYSTGSSRPYRRPSTATRRSAGGWGMHAKGPLSCGSRLNRHTHLGQLKNVLTTILIHIGKGGQKIGRFNQA